MNQLPADFTVVYALIQTGREAIFKQVNRQLVLLYWSVGEYIAQKTQQEGWGRSTVQNLADYIAQQDVTLQGFTTRNLWRMKLFYETYVNYPNLTTLLSEIQWSAHLHILNQTNAIEEK
jgi:hypothetical protein